jgi:hypothetical protein
MGLKVTSLTVEKFISWNAQIPSLEEQFDREELARMKQFLPPVKPAKGFPGNSIGQVLPQYPSAGPRTGFADFFERKPSGLR